MTETRSKGRRRLPGSRVGSPVPHDNIPVAAFVGDGVDDPEAGVYVGPKGADVLTGDVRDGAVVVGLLGFAEVLVQALDQALPAMVAADAELPDDDVGRFVEGLAAEEEGVDRLEERSDERVTMSDGLGGYEGVSDHLGLVDGDDGRGCGVHGAQVGEIVFGGEESLLGGLGVGQVFTEVGPLQGDDALQFPFL